MTEQEIIEKTNKVFEESFEIAKERLVPQAHIFTDLGLDSLDIVDLIVHKHQITNKRRTTNTKLKMFGY